MGTTTWICTWQTSFPYSFYIWSWEFLIHHIFYKATLWISWSGVIRIYSSWTNCLLISVSSATPRQSYLVLCFNFDKIIKTDMYATLKINIDICSYNQHIHSTFFINESVKNVFNLHRYEISQYSPFILHFWNRPFVVSHGIFVRSTNDVSNRVIIQVWSCG